MRKPPAIAVDRALTALAAAYYLERSLSALLAAHPQLGAAGFVDDVPAERPSADHVRRCLAWLCEEVQPLAGVNSYSLKHDVEGWARKVDPDANAYVTNGAMIAALLLAGWPLRRCGLNAVVKRVGDRGTTHMQCVSDRRGSGRIARISNSIATRNVKTRSPRITFSDAAK